MPITIACTGCDKKLKVPDTAAGKKVRCPACKAVVAVPEAEELVEPDDFVKPDEESAVAEAPLPKKKKAAWDDDDADVKKRKSEDEEDYAFDDDDDEERRRRKKKQKRKRFEEDFQDRKPRYGEAHRGVLIMVLGMVTIVGGCLCAFIGWGLGSVVLNMANTDLAKMDNGVMDRAGRSMTTAGKACAIVGIGVGLVNAIFGIAMNVNKMK